MFRHLSALGIVSILAIGLSACQQEQTTLKFEPGTVFQDRYSDDIFQLSHDDGSDVELRAVRPRGMNGARGTSPTGGTDHDIFNYNGCGIFGCNNDPWSYWLGYSNYTHSWNPHLTRNLVIQFRQQLVTTMQYPQNPYSTASCWDINIQSSHKVILLRGRSAHGGAPLRGSGNYTTQARVRIGSLNQLPGTLVLGLQENPYQGCSVPEWWNYPSYFVWPGCGGNRTQATLKITGTVSQCGMNGAAESPMNQTVNVDLSAYVNSQLQTFYYMPYFNVPATQDQSYFLTGRVVDYGNDYHYWGAP